MPTLFCVRPATRNIGNDIIAYATADLLLAAFGSHTGIVNIPALKGPEFGGFTARQVYDMNRFADGIVLGGGNLFENGQVTIDLQALAALRVPMMLIGLSHGRIYDANGELVDRTDSMAPAIIRLLASKSCTTLVRDNATRTKLIDLGVETIVGGCPTIFMPENPAGWVPEDRILVSIRHPSRMSVPPVLQWRVIDDLRRLLAALRAEFSDEVVLACHDYADIEFASGFPEVPMIYFDTVERYVDALRRCRLSITYRLHSFLPCLAFGTPTIHLSYDERGRDMVATAGMGTWDVDTLRENDVVAAVMGRSRNIGEFHKLRNCAKSTIAELRRTTISAITDFARHTTQFNRRQGNERPE